MELEPPLQMATPLACLLFSRVAVSDPELGDGGKGRRTLGVGSNVGGRKRRGGPGGCAGLCWLLASRLQLGRAIDPLWAGARVVGACVGIACCLYTACRRTGEAPAFFRGAKSLPMVFTFSAVAARDRFMSLSLDAKGQGITASRAC